MNTIRGKNEKQRYLLKTYFGPDVHFNLLICNAWCDKVWLCMSVSFDGNGGEKSPRVIHSYS